MPMVNEIQCYATLHKQIRDHEDEITVTFRCSASEFDKVIGIPTQELLILKISLAPKVAVNLANDSQRQVGENAE